MKKRELRRDLGLTDTTMVNVGVMIGSGIFFTPNLIAADIHQPWIYLAIWVFGGLISLCGAAALAELGAAMPRAGGQFVYLKEIYGPMWGFLYGWSSFTVINTASIAAIAVAFATYAAPWFGLSGWGIKFLAIAVILLLTLCNIRGVKWAALVQNTFGFAKVAALLALVVLCLLWAPERTPAVSDATTTQDPWALVKVLGTAMIAVLWSYEGWIEATYTAAEVKHPQRNLPLALFISTLAVTALYLVVNAGYLAALGLDGIRASERVAADAAEAAVGVNGANFVTLAVLISTFGATNGFILGAARVYYGMGQEGLFFRRFGAAHPEFQTPSLSLWCQMAWAILLVLSGTFNQLITYVVFASWVFYGLCAFGIFILRKRQQGKPLPYRAWGYPITPILFGIFATMLVFDTIRADPFSAGIGALLIITGIPAYFLWKRFKKQEDPA